MTGLTQKIWIVDDEIELAQSYSNYLENDFQTQIFSTAEEALIAFDSEETFPNVLITDIKMPGMSGISLLSELNKRLGNKLPPIIIISGNFQKSDLLRTIDLSISSFLEKPFDPDLLKKKVLETIIKRELKINSNRRLNLITEQNKLLLELSSRYYLRLSKAENRLFELSPKQKKDDKEVVKNFLTEFYEENALTRRINQIQNELNLQASNIAGPLPIRP